MNATQNLSAHMSNENTFLAWVRTSLALMAFGFVIERFTLFLKQFSRFIQKATGLTPITPPQAQEYTALFGIMMIAMGALICFLSFVNYKMTQKKIETNVYQPTALLTLILTLFVLLIGIVLVLSLVHVI